VAIQGLREGAFRPINMSNERERERERERVRGGEGERERGVLVVQSCFRLVSCLFNT
jgi:hypothetical protein